jgi:hypothetical protein
MGATLMIASMPTVIIVLIFMLLMQAMFKRRSPAKPIDRPETTLRALFVPGFLVVLVACSHPSAPDTRSVAEKGHDAMCSTAAEAARAAQILPTSYLKQHCENSEPDKDLSVVSICLAYQYRLKMLHCK